MDTQEAFYSIALRRCNNVGDINFYKLVKTVGSAEQVWNLPKNKLHVFGIGNKIISDIGNAEHLKFAEKEIAFCEKNDISILLRHQKNIPTFLLECTDAPAILYCKGNFDSQKIPISIVGTRNITSYGKQFVHDFMQKIKSSIAQTISGLAYGVDTEVHKESIHNQIPTVAVLAHGFHTLYPSKNKNLSDKILENNGVLLTEFNSSQKPDRENFIQRNRIIAGISPSTIVVETAFGGGSISTANFANGYNRDVYALPGKLHDKYSQGCNMLIAQNKANIIFSIKDLLDDLNLFTPQDTQTELFPSEKTLPQLTDLQSLIYNSIVEKTQITLDEISEKLELPSFEIMSELLELELLGIIKSHSGQQFSAS